MSTQKIRHTFGLTLPDWRMGVERMVLEVLD
jgi:dTDP-4-dehydrorhamnose reductase